MKPATNRRGGFGAWLTTGQPGHRACFIGNVSSIGYSTPSSSNKERAIAPSQTTVQYRSLLPERCTGQASLAQAGASPCAPAFRGKFYAAPRRIAAGDCWRSPAPFDHDHGDLREDRRRCFARDCAALAGGEAMLIAGSTIHSLRHSFAVRALQTCPDGRDRITKHMVALSTYLGHSRVADTYWYLEATPSLMKDIADSCQGFFP